MKKLRQAGGSGGAGPLTQGLLSKAKAVVRAGFRLKFAPRLASRRELVADCEQKMRETEEAKGKWRQTREEEARKKGKKEWERASDLSHLARGERLLNWHFLFKDMVDCFMEKMAPLMGLNPAQIGALEEEPYSWIEKRLMGKFLQTRSWILSRPLDNLLPLEFLDLMSSVLKDRIKEEKGLLEEETRKTEEERRKVRRDEDIFWDVLLGHQEKVKEEFLERKERGEEAQENPDMGTKTGSELIERLLEAGFGSGYEEEKRRVEARKRVIWCVHGVDDFYHTPPI